MGGGSFLSLFWTIINITFYDCPIKNHPLGWFLRNLFKNYLAAASFEEAAPEAIASA